MFNIRKNTSVHFRLTGTALSRLRVDCESEKLVRGKIFIRWKVEKKGKVGKAWKEKIFKLFCGRGNEMTELFDIRQK